MQYYWIKYIIRIFFSIVLILLCFNAAFGQFFLYSEAPANIDVSFTRHSIEARAQQAVFNVLKIKNNANRLENVILNITVPQGWSVIGQERMELSLGPLDSIIVPIRIAVGANVRGDIGYSIIASIADLRGNTIKNEYAYVKIPRETDLNVRILDRLSYLDPVSGISTFSLRVDNRGNRDEPVTLLFDGNRRLGIGENAQNLVAYDYVIPPYIDSVFTFRVVLDPERVQGRNMFGLHVITTTIDTVLRSTIWFRKIDSRARNNILVSDRPLSVEIIGQGLLDAAKKPTVSLFVEGKTLFEGESEVYYYYRNFRSTEPIDFYENTRMYIGGKFKNWNIEVGDRYRSYETFSSGRGLFLAYDNSKLRGEALVNADRRASLENLGGQLTYSLTHLSAFGTGLYYTKSTITDFESTLGFLSSKFTVGRKHNFYTLLGYNQINRELDGKNKHEEFGAEFNYNSNIRSLRTNVRFKYGSPLYYSMFAGRLDGFANSLWTIDHRNKLSFYVIEQQNVRPTIQNNSILRTVEMGNREFKVEHHYLLPPSVQLFYGPSVQRNQWSGLQVFSEGPTFTSMNYKIIIGSRYRNTAGTFSVSPKVELAYVDVLDNPFESGDRRKNSTYQHFSVGYRDSYLNVLAFFTAGPRSAVDQINFASSGRLARKLQFMPAYDRFVYQDVIRLYAGLSYTNDIVASTSYSTVTGQVYWYLPNNWRLYALGVYSIQNRSNPQGIVESFQNIYIETSIRKEFEIQHPRVKFYDIDLVFFKDFNGNFIQEPNEPGIKDILAIIQLESTGIKGRVPGDFFSAELMTDNTGRIRLEQIPEGRYTISYNPVGTSVGTFSKVIGDTEFIVNRSGEYYFPFVEKNKVFGRIILNRSRLSGLGRIDVSNVRITATDSQGRSYSTLTNREGYFEIFAPVTDEYILTINNIFFENFDLRQNNFLVQFNAYKQFEVNFVFDEKVRHIRFAATADADVQIGVMQVRRTTISGKVKDANTQQPVRARVNLINTRTNSVVTSTNSSATSGEYTMSFIAGDNYLLEVVADDYWYLSENLVLQQITTFMNINRDVLLRPVSVGSKVELNIQFDINSAYLAPESVAELNRLLRQIKNNPTVKLEIQGHSDELEAIRSPGIALERANAVASYLIENGYSNLEVKSYDNTVPTASNDTEEGRARNRRIEVVVLSR